MKKLLIVCVLTGVTMLGACTKFYAMKGPFDDNAVNPAFVEYISGKAEDRLDLTEAQRGHLQSIIHKMTAKALEQRPQVNELRAKMAAEVKKPQLDMDKMEMLMKERMQFFRVIMDSEKEDLLIFHSTLSEFQREALAKLILDHGKKGWHGSH